MCIIVSISMLLNTMYMMCTSEDEDECLARQLMNKMNPAVLSKLRRCFKKTRDKVKRDKDIDRYLMVSVETANAVQCVLSLNLSVRKERKRPTRIGLV